MAVNHGNMRIRQHRSDDAFALLVGEVLVDAVEVLPNLRKASVLGDLQLDGDLHVGGGGDADVDAAVPLHDAGGSEQHFAPDLALDLLPAEVAHADVPVLLLFLKSIAYVVEIPRRHYQHLLVAQVDHLRVARRRLEHLLELLDVGVELPLQLEVVGDGLVGLVVGGEGEEVLEGVELALLVAVQLQRVGRVRLRAAGRGRHLEDAAQLPQLVPEQLEVGVLFANHLRKLPRSLLLLLLGDGLALLLLRFLEEVRELVGDGRGSGLGEVLLGYFGVGAVLFLDLLAGLHELVVLLVDVGVVEAVLGDEAGAEAADGRLANTLH